MDKFALIWLSVIAFLMISVLFTVSPAIGALAAGSAVAMYLGMRWLRRERQARRVIVDREVVVEREEVVATANRDAADEPSHRQAS